MRWRDGGNLEASFGGVRHVRKKEKMERWRVGWSDGVGKGCKSKC